MIIKDSRGIGFLSYIQPARVGRCVFQSPIMGGWNATSGYSGVRIIYKKAYPIGIRLSIIISKPDQLFTPPSATPAMIYLDNRKYTTISGRTVSVSPRYIEPNSVL